MFNVGGGELLVILLVALVVLGPQKLPEAARKVGSAMGELRKLSSGFQAEMRSALSDVDESVKPAKALKGGQRRSPTEVSPRSAEKVTDGADPSGVIETDAVELPPAEPAAGELAPAEPPAGELASPEPAAHDRQEETGVETPVETPVETADERPRFSAPDERDSRVTGGATRDPAAEVTGPAAGSQS